MNTTDLKKELDNLGISESLYSLDGSLDCDRIILYENYYKWEVFYFSERGTRDNYQIFFSEDEACRYNFDLFRNKKSHRFSYECILESTRYGI
ncbi:MAG: Uncharacterized protein F083_2886 [bacterium F083]|nr:MAG: Uncharacterized protein F083_2886 [bacterium F083]